MNMNKDYVLSILLISILFCIVPFVTNIQNPVGIVIKQYTNSNFLSQLGNFSIYIAYFFMGIPAGILLSRLRYRKMIILSLCVGFVSFILMFLGCYFFDYNSNLFFLIYLVGVFISGCCMCMINTIVNPLANKLGGGGNKGNQLIQFGTFTSSIVAIIVPILCGFILGSIESVKIKSIIPIFMFEAVIFIIILVFVYIMHFDEKYDNIQMSNEKINRFAAFKYPHFVFGIIAIFCYLGIEVGIPNISNLFLVNEFGLETIVAASVVSTLYFFMMIGRLVGFFISSKISSNVMLKYASIIAIFLVLMSINIPANITFHMVIINTNLSFEIISLPIGLLLLIFIGFFISIMWGTIFNLAITGLGKYTEHASGILMIMLCGGGILPLIQASIVDITGSYPISFVLILVLLIYILWYSIKGYKIKKE